MRKYFLLAFLIACFPAFAFDSGFNEGNIDASHKPIYGDSTDGIWFDTDGDSELPYEITFEADGSIVFADSAGIRLYGGTLQYSNDLVNWSDIGSGGTGGGSTVKVDGITLSTANFVDGTDITVTATGSSVGMALASAVSSNIGLGVTAHGWGNHAVAGYATNANVSAVNATATSAYILASTALQNETDTLQTVTNRGSVTTANITAGYFFGNGSQLSGISTSESDTLQTVTSRGNTTSGGITVNGTTATNSLRVGTSATAGQVLTADSGGNATWQNATGGGGGSSQVIPSRIPSPWSRYASSSTSTVLATSDNGFTVNSVYVQLNPMNQSTQLNGNLRYSDHNGSNPYLICALDTTNGSATITNMTNAVVPAGKRVYVDWDDAPAITIDEQVAAINVTRVP